MQRLKSVCKHIWAGLLAGLEEPRGAPLITEQAKPQMVEMIAELTANVKGGQAKAEGQG